MNALFTVLVNDAVFRPRANEPTRLAKRCVLSVQEGLVGEGSQVREVPSQAPTELQDGGSWGHLDCFLQRESFCPGQSLAL